MDRSNKGFSLSFLAVLALLSIFSATSGEEVHQRAKRSPQMPNLPQPPTPPSGFPSPMLALHRIARQSPPQGPPKETPTSPPEATMIYQSELHRQTREASDVNMMSGKKMGGKRRMLVAEPRVKRDARGTGGKLPSRGG
ncbi:uncharacterized protein LOC131689169 [Topomyia yanbarensis]|uniref:uncharacterized protein LOC131689169 n=1 Tax=Topomyia yanbarensis TaxID=2498891 RepID=UPI00273BA210|nr:uncharacterized protein LOC131689169 [Topomyia yanbarensis]